MISLGLLVRGTAVLSALVAVNALTWLTLDDLRRPPTTLLPDLIAAGAAWLLQASLAWVLVATLAVLLEAATSAIPRCSRGLGCPPALRRAILAACGIGLLGVSAPALADDAVHAPPPASSPLSVDLTGLRLPDRTVGAATRPPPPRDVRPVVAPAPTRTPATDRPRTVTVRAGDSLWSIVAAHLGHGASDRRVATEVDRWVRANAATLADPDLITPGQHLIAPTSEES